MRKGFLTALAIMLSVAAVAEAQQGQPPLPPMPEPVPAPATLGVQQLPPPAGLTPIPGPLPYPAYPPGPVPPAPSSGPIVDPVFVPLHDRPPGLMDLQQRGWVTLDFLAWWMKPGPSPSPLVTVGSANDSIPGALGQPSTAVLIGGRNIDYGSFSGARIDAGFWLPWCPNIGLEAAYVGLQQRTIGFSAFSDGNGDPVIARPVINAQTGTETSYVDSYPGAAIGGATVTSRSTFDTWEINAIFNMLKTQHWSWNAIVGFRSLDLTEDLQIQDIVTPLAAGNFTFLGGLRGSAQHPFSITNNFHTGNHFYGGQLGSRPPLEHWPVRHRLDGQSRPGCHAADYYDWTAARRC